MSETIRKVLSSTDFDEPRHVAHASPYPGLRPFRPDENELFFGRESQIDSLAEKLARNRFVAVVGPSGCGKSSLVQAGLLPEVQLGLLPGAEAGCRMAILRPGARPLAALAEAVIRMDELEAEQSSPELVRKIGALYATLRRGDRGLIEVVRQLSFQPDTGLLILLDQFEEVFRFRHAASFDEANALVTLILKTVDDEAEVELPCAVYVVITMRSDFIGHCNRFAGLPEAINESQFLTPRLTRDERRAAIVGPCRYVGGSVRPELVSRLLNDMGDDPDQLPIMQHSMMRMWSRAAVRADGDDGTSSVELTLEDYEFVGGWKGTLSRHANEAFNELGPDQRAIAETLFRCLTDPGPDGKGIRRPVTVETVARVAETDLDRISAVADRFRQTGRSFLTPPPDQPLRLETVLDIGHESLIRQWDQLRTWVKDEAQSAETYRRLEDKARRWKAGREAYSQPPALHFEIDWKESARPNPDWAQRYGEHFDLAMQYLAASEDAWRRKEEADRQAEEEARRRERELAAAKAQAAREAEERRRERAEAEAREREQEARRERERAARYKGYLVTLGVSLVAVIALAVAAIWGWQSSVKQSRNLKSTSAANCIERGLYSCERGDVGIGMSWFLVADEIAPDDDEAHARARRLAASWGRSLDYQIVHPEAVTLAAFNPAASQFVTVRNDDSMHSMRWWDAERRRSIGSVIHPDSGVKTLAFDPDGQFVVTAHQDNSVRMWRPGDENALTFPHQHTVTAVAVGNAPSTCIATGCVDGSMHIWNTDGQGPRSVTGHSDKINALLFAPAAETLLLSCSEDGTAKLWQVGESISQRGELTTEEDEGAVLSGSFAPSGDEVITGTSGGAVQVWNVESRQGRFEKPLRVDGPVRSVAFSPDASTLLTISGNRATLWDAASGDPRGSAMNHRDSIAAVAFHPTRPAVLTASRDKTARLWDAVTGAPLSRPLKHKGAVNAACFGGDPGDWILTASDDGTCRLWKSIPRLPRFVCELESSNLPLTLAYLPDGTLSAIDQFGGLYFWDETGEPKAHGAGALKGETLDFYAAASNGQDAVTLDYAGALQLWNVATGEPRPGEKTSEKANCVAIGADGERVLIGENDGGLTLWNAADWSVVRSFPPRQRSVEHVAISRDGTMVAAVTDDGIARIYEVSSGDEMGNVLLEESEIRVVAFDAGSGGRSARALAIGCDNGRFLLRDVENRDPLTEPVVYPARIAAATFSSLNGNLAVVVDNGILYVWDSPRPQTVNTGSVKDWIQDNVSKGHWDRILPANRDAASMISSLGEENGE